MKARKINWKRQVKRESFFLKNGRMPRSKDMRRAAQPAIFYGLNTTKG